MPNGGPEDHDLNPLLGIDLGTTYSAIARWDGRGPRVYPTPMGPNELQSAVYYDPAAEQVLVGGLAYKKGLVNPENLAIGFKRDMDDVSKKITLGGRDFTPVELSAEVLSHLYKGVAQKFPQGRFQGRGTVVTVPYYFKNHQIKNTRDAADMADIQCIGILQEPIAASLQYAWHLIQENPERELSQNILVFDLGGGTFDLTLFKLENTRDKLIFEVLATGGDDRLGGMDFDRCMVDLLLKKGDVSLSGLSPLEERKAQQKLYAAAVETKEALAFCECYQCAVPFVVGATSIQTEVSRQEFVECIQHYIKDVGDGDGRTGGKKPIVEILEGLWSPANLKASEVDRVIRVGGSSRIPTIKELLENVFGKEKVYSAANESLAVVEGAALYAASLIDPEVIGRDIEIKTRTCHALGIEDDYGKFSRVIPANRLAPCQETRVYTNPRDNVKSLHFKVYQGSSEVASKNSFIGTISIHDLPPRPKGTLDILVTFRISKEQNLAVDVEVFGSETTDSKTKKRLGKETGVFSSI